MQPPKAIIGPTVLITYGWCVAGLDPLTTTAGFVTFGLVLTIIVTLFEMLYVNLPRLQARLLTAEWQKLPKTGIHASLRNYYVRRYDRRQIWHGAAALACSAVILKGKVLIGSVPLLQRLAYLPVCILLYCICLYCAREWRLANELHGFYTKSAYRLLPPEGVTDASPIPVHHEFPWKWK